MSNQSLKPSSTVAASTQTDDAIGTYPNGTLPIGTDSNETLTSAALSFISCNLPAVLISSSIAHQAAKTVQRCIRRFLGSTDTARKRAVAALQQQDDRLYGTYLGRRRTIQTMCMNNRTAASVKFSEGTILLVSGTQLEEIDAYRQRGIHLVSRSETL
jgi:hypothetical protein